MFRSLLFCCLMVMASGAVLADPPALNATALKIPIEPQSLATALQAWAQQSGVQVLYATELAAGLKSRGAPTGLTVTESLEHILAGTGLEYRILNERTVSVITHVRKTSKSPSSSETQEPATSGTVPAQTVGSPLDESRVLTKTNALEEIIVTAQKKSERLQDVPVPVSVLNAEQLADNGQTLLRDYYASVPGLNISPSVEGYQYLSIRGVTPGGGAPTVGIMIDAVPYGGSLNFQVPEIDPGDLARIEVLRGPQGALYGADSMGGLLNFVTIDPSTRGISGRIEAGTSSVRNGAEPGFDVRGSVNVPLTDTLAIRVSGFNRQDAGYIDNPAYSLQGVNQSEANGGRLAALWTPSDAVSLKLNALYQHYKTDGSSDVVIGAGDLHQNDQYLANFGGYDRKVQAYSATLNVKFGGISLTSLTGYNVNQVVDSWQSTYAFGSIAQNGGGIPGFNGFGVAGAPLVDREHYSNFSQEVRLSASVGKNFEWLVGGFYTHQTTQYHQDFLATSPTTGRTVGELGYDDFPGKFEEYAAFANITYHFTDRFDVQMGGRDSEIKVTNLTATESGPLFTLSPFTVPLIAPELEAKSNAFTYLLTPRFKVSPDLMVYARLASGYRPGGSNNLGAVTSGAPAQFNPDKTKDYEIGVKGDFFDHRVAIDASLYYIDWKGIQLPLQTPPPVIQGYTANGGAAKSEGVEFSIEAKPLKGMTVAAWIDYDNAVLTENFPANSQVYGATGDRLPNTSRFSGSLSIEQSFPLGADIDGFVGGAVSYVGDRIGVFNYIPPAIPPRQDYPGYTKTDLRAGLRFESWTANVYVNNVADIRGVVSGGIGYFPSFSNVYITPRTIGVSMSKRFN